MLDAHLLACTWASSGAHVRVCGCVHALVRTCACGREVPDAYLDRQPEEVMAEPLNGRPWGVSIAAEELKEMDLAFLAPHAHRKRDI